MTRFVLATVVVLGLAAPGHAGEPPAGGPERSPANAGPPEPAPDPAVDRAARQLLDRFRAEPTVRETQAAATRHAGIVPDRPASWQERARWAAAAPELLGEYRRAAATDRTLGSQASGTVDYSGLDREDRTTVRARWELDRLVFNPDELRVAAEAIELVELRQTVVDQVTRLYFERRRQQVELLRPALDLEARLPIELRVEELTASLDGLTGGWFSSRLAAGNDRGIAVAPALADPEGRGR